MVQLREYGLRNEALQVELEQTRAELQESRRAEIHGTRVAPGSTEPYGRIYNSTVGSWYITWEVLRSKLRVK